MKEELINKAYEIAKERYAKGGVAFLGNFIRLVYQFFFHDTFFDL